MADKRRRKVAYKALLLAFYAAGFGLFSSCLALMLKLITFFPPALIIICLIDPFQRHPPPFPLQNLLVCDLSSFPRD